MLNPEQIAQYEKDGYLIIRGQFDESEMQRLDAAAERNPPLNATMGGLKYPEPGRYTLAKSCFKDADLAYFAEHPAILAGSRALLDDDVYLTAYVLYDRTPGGPAIGAHNDYKRWRPVGSSMHWLFTIIPQQDFDADNGQLFVYPGSHRLERVQDRGGRALDVDPAVAPAKDGFIDPRLKRGDLLFMNMHTWHHAAGNQSNRHRIGLFNKYAARSCPPATGPFVYDEAAKAALSPESQDILQVASNKPVQMTRLILERTHYGKREVFLGRDSSTDALTFPGGPVFAELAIPDWDYGNYIEALRDHIRTQLKVETPWMTWVGDWEEGDGLCRVYAYPMSGQGFPVPYRDGEWVKFDLAARVGALGWEREALDAWLDPAMIRGKGVSQAQARIDQYAY